MDSKVKAMNEVLNQQAEMLRNAESKYFLLGIVNPKNIR
jgi:hypothetical protein